MSTDDSLVPERDDIPRFGVREHNDAITLIEMSLEEDLAGSVDCTCAALIAEDARGSVDIVARQPGRLSGLPAVQLVFERLDPEVRFDPLVPDGSVLSPGQPIARLTGKLQPLLIGERTALNLLTHLSGIATLTAEFVTLADGCTVLDTRKTLPGYRALQKYAVRCGGGTNHRFGLHDGILIKDNHLAAWRNDPHGGTVAGAVRAARAVADGLTVEVEVDSLEQLRDALCGRPDIVLLDNMSPDQLAEAVAIRDASGNSTLLEASGGIHLQNAATIAGSGVDRISIGALTHSAPSLDLGFDWHEKTT